MVELVYTADLKSAAARIEGSSPSPATNKSTRDKVMKKQWTVVIYNLKTNVTKISNELESVYTENAKMMIEARLNPEQRVIAMIPGHHAAWSKGWWTPLKRSPVPNCS